MLFQNSSHMCRSFSFSLCVCMLSHVRFNRVSIVGEELFIRYTFDVNRNPIALYLLATGLCFAFVAVVFRSQESFSSFLLFYRAMFGSLSLRTKPTTHTHRISWHNGILPLLLLFLPFLYVFCCHIFPFFHCLWLSKSNQARKKGQQTGNFFVDYLKKPFRQTQPTHLCTSTNLLLKDRAWINLSNIKWHFKE